MFFKRFWMIFSFKNCFTPQFLARKPERAVAFTAGSCVSERAGCKKPASSERLLSQSDCLISLIKNNNIYYPRLSARAPAIIAVIFVGTPFNIFVLSIYSPYLNNSYLCCLCCECLKVFTVNASSYDLYR
jgi:hypothetical protein